MNGMRQWDKEVFFLKNDIEACLSTDRYESMNRGKLMMQKEKIIE